MSINELYEYLFDVIFLHLLSRRARASTTLTPTIRVVQMPISVSTTSGIHILCLPNREMMLKANATSEITSVLFAFIIITKDYFTITFFVEPSLYLMMFRPFCGPSTFVPSSR